MTDEKKALQGGQIKLGDYELELGQFAIPSKWFVLSSGLADVYKNGEKTGDKFLRIRVLNGDLVEMLQKQNMLIDTVAATAVQVDIESISSNVDINNSYITLDDLHVFLKWNRDATRYDGLKCTAGAFKSLK